MNSLRASCLDAKREYMGPTVLQTQELSVVQEKEPCIGFTQKNSIKNSVQNSLPYI